MRDGVWAWGRAIIVLAGCGGASLFAYNMLDMLKHVNEPRIEARHHQEARKHFPELIAPDAKLFRVRWIERDVGAEIFEYVTDKSLADLQQLAQSTWTVTLKSKSLVHLESSGSTHGFSFGQAVKSGNRVFIILVAHEGQLSSEDWEKNIRAHTFAGYGMGK